MDCCIRTSWCLCWVVVLVGSAASSSANADPSIEGSSENKFIVHQTHANIVGYLDRNGLGWLSTRLTNEMGGGFSVTAARISLKGRAEIRIGDRRVCSDNDTVTHKRSLMIIRGDQQFGVENTSRSLAVISGRVGECQTEAIFLGKKIGIGWLGDLSRVDAPGGSSYLLRTRQRGRPIGIPNFIGRRLERWIQRRMKQAPGG